MLRRFTIIFLIFILCAYGEKSFALSQYSTMISKMEKSLFGIDYNNQTDDARLKRIEENVYGQASSKPMNQRVEKLSKDLAAEYFGQEIKPKADTFEDEENNYTEEIPKADANVNYPIVDNLEAQVFKKEYKSLEINKRLAGLESKVFNKTYDSESLNSRVERLKSQILKNRQTIVDNNLNDSNYPESTGAASDLPQNFDDFMSQNNNLATQDYNSENSVFDSYKSNSNISVPLSAMEKSVLKKTFPDDTPSNRLTRLEVSMFNTSFIQDDEQTRIDRIASAYKAKKTASKYDSNKFSQHMSTAMQIGTMLLMVLAFVL